MRKRRNFTLRSFVFTFLAALLLTPSLHAQKRLRLVVYEEAVTGCSGCDGSGWYSSDNDHRMSWEGGNINNECHSFGDNNDPPRTNTDSYTLYDETFDCQPDWPGGNLTYTWFVDEADGLCGCAFGALTCSDNSQGQSFGFPVSTATGNINLPQQSVGGGGDCGCVTYTYRARWVITGSFLTEDYNNDLCNAGALGTLNFGGSLGLNNQSNQSPCDDCQSGEPNCSNDPSVWYQFTTGATVAQTINIEIDATGGGMDAWVGVYIDPGNCNTLNDLQQINTGSSIANPFGTSDASTTIDCPLPNTTYWIQVDGLDVTGSSGTFNVSVDDNNVSAGAHDDICDAFNLGTLNLGGTLQNNNFNNFCSGTQPGEPNPAAFAIDQTQWFTFTTGANIGTQTTLEALNDPLNRGDQIDLQIALYTSSNSTCTGSFTEIDSDYFTPPFGEEMTVECLQPNTTYYMQVDGSGLNVQGFFGVRIDDNGVAGATNDDICSAISLGTVPFGGSQTNNNMNNFCATIQTGEPNSPGCIYSIDQTIWVSFTTGASVGYEMTIASVSDPLNAGDNLDLQVSLLQSSNGTCTGTLTEVDCDYDPDVPGFWNGEDLVVECLQPNTTYFVQLDGSAINVEGYIGLTVTDDGIARAPNDLICNSTPLGTIPNAGNVTLNNQNNYCGGIEPGEPDPLSHDVEQTVWYSFVPPSSGSVEIELFNTGSDDIDLQLSVWESSDNTCTGLFSELDSYDDPLSFSIDGGQAMRLKCLDTTKTYYIQVDGWEDPLNILPLREGIFDISVDDYNVGPAPNDSICDAIPLGDPTGGSVTAPGVQTNFCANNIFDPIPSCFGTNRTVWYQFIAPSTGRVTIELESDPNNVGDYIDLQVSVWETVGDSCLGAISEVACDYNDLFEFPPFSRDEDILVTCLTPGRPYWIMVDGSDDPDEVDGFFNITVTEEPGPPPITNDSICGATAMGPVPGGGSINSGEQHNFCATVEPGEPVPAAFGLDQTVWYTFQAPPSGNVTLALDTDPNNRGDDIDLQVAVYESSDNTCNGTLSEVDSDYDPIILDEDLTVTCLDPGRTYFIQVDGSLLPPPPLPTVFVEGYFDITITEDPAFVPLPTNDSLCNAVDLGVPPTGLGTPIFSGSNFCATTEAGEQNVDNCSNFFNFICDETVWFYFTTNNNPGTISVEITNATGIDANINVYAAPGGVSCDFNDLQFIGDADNLLSFDVSLDLPCLDPNSVYFVQVDGGDVLGNFGTFDIQIIDDAVPQPQVAYDSICSAQALGVVASGGSTPTFAGNNLCAGEEPNEPNVSGLNDITDVLYDETVWFTFTTSATPGLVTVNVSNVQGGLAPGITAYLPANGTTCAFSDLTEIDNAQGILAGANVSLPLPCLQPNTTYYVQLDGLDVIGDDGTFDITVTDDGNPNSFPPNDDICNASNIGTVPVGGSTAAFPSNNFCATTESNEPNVSGCNVLSNPLCDETVWFTFTTPGTPGNTTVTVNNTVGIDATINVYAANPQGSCNFSDLTLLENGDDLLSSDVSVTIPCLRPNTTYYVQVDGVDILGDNGTFDITVSDDGTMNAYPPNDSICNATPMGVVPSGGTSPTISSFNFCATTEPNEPNVDNCATVSALTCDETVWFEFTTSATPGEITVTVDNTVGIDANIDVYLAPPPVSCNFNSLVQIASADNLLSTDVSLDLPCLTPNTTYYVQVDGLDVFGDQGTFDITVTDNGVPTGSPTNDNICSRQYIGDLNSGPIGPVNGTNDCATVEPNEPNVGNNDETVWYSFVAPTSGQAFIDVNSISGIDVNFNLYHNSGGCIFDSLYQVGGNANDLLSFDADLAEDCLIPGDTYMVQIDGVDILGDFGDFTISITDPQPTFSGPSNDDCGGAIPLPIGTEPCQGSGNWNVFNYGDPTVSLNNNFVQGCGDNCGDVWFSFTMPASGTVLMEGNDDYGFLGLNNSELAVAAYEGPCNNLTPTNCDVGGTFSDPQYYIQGTPGQTYYLQVFDDGGDDINEDFGLCLTDRCGSDSCQTATPMQDGIWYCWDTDGATGETPGVDPGYTECGDGSAPDHSVYFSYTTDSCPTIILTVQGTIGGSCILSQPTDGLSIAIFQDATPCDNAPDALVDCELTDACEGTSYFFTRGYNLPIGTQLIIQLDGFQLTGNNNGQIRIDEVCPLDVEYESFVAYREGVVHELEWAVSDADALQGTFFIERSLDATNFQQIGEVDGQSTASSGGSASGSNSGYDYRFTDYQPVPGHNYYRLNFLDQNGEQSYSEVVDVYFDEFTGVRIVGLYPNPASDRVTLSTFVGMEGEFEVEFVDLNGKVIRTETMEFEAGFNEKEFVLDDITGGMYVIRLRDQANRTEDHIKFIKQ